MTMPHSKRPRRNKLNKIRKKQGLPPLPVLIPDHGIERKEPKQPPGIGVTTIMVPLPAPARELLTRMRLAAQLNDPSIKASDQLFAGAVLTVALVQMAELAPAPGL